VKIAVTSFENNLDSLVCPQFGRANYFLIIDTQTLDYEVITNPNIKVVDGAGIQSAQLLIKEEIKALFTGRVGMNAFRILDSAGILIYENVEGIVRVVIDKLKLGILHVSNNFKQPNHHSREMHCYGKPIPEKNAYMQLEKEKLKIEIEKLKEKISLLENQLKTKHIKNI